VPTLSIIVPTRNRTNLWRSAWLLDSLRAQTEPPDELVIALDHTEDETLAAITADISTRPARFPVKILDVLAPRPGPFPASGIPDNCAFHAATGEVILHVDDDIRLPPDFCRRTRNLFEDLPQAAVWYLMTFVDQNHKPLPAGTDWRIPHIEKNLSTRLPGALIKPDIHSMLFTGAIFATTRHIIRTIGGHALETCGYHNQDTRLGNRIARLFPSYISTSVHTRSEHLGTTWHMQHRTESKTLRDAYGPPRDPKICNGGPTFWNSSWFNNAYRLTWQTSELQSHSVRP
jgi:glycosyltransferase involved in cell wall biosynthesis